MEIVIGFLIWSFVLGGIGALIGACKNRVAAGVIWSVLLGPIGWLITALLEDYREKCPECGGAIVPNAQKCQHCSSVIGEHKKDGGHKEDIEFECKQCGQLVVSDEATGETVECPICKTSLKVPVRKAGETRPTPVEFPVIILPEKKETPKDTPFWKSAVSTMCVVLIIAVIVGFVIWGQHNTENGATQSASQRPVLTEDEATQSASQRPVLVPGSLEELKANAKKGNAEAQFKLGCRYYLGEGVAGDPVEVAKWWRKAAEQNHVEAQYWLGERYANGKGVTKDEVEAAYWYRKAAEQGNAEAKDALERLGQK